MTNESQYQIDIFQTVRKKFLSDEQIRNIVCFVLKEQKVKSAYIDIAVVGDKYMKKMTAKYSGKQYCTDVLSFDLGAEGKVELMAQVIVNAQLACRVAKKNAASVSAELAMYVIHGLLHLLGFDDKTPEDAQKMHAETFELLKKLKFKRLPPMPSHFAHVAS